MGGVQPQPEVLEQPARLRATTKITPDSFTVDYRCVPRVSVKGAAAYTRARFVVDDGIRGMRQTYDNPSTAYSAPAPTTERKMIRDTVAAETH